MKPAVTNRYIQLTLIRDQRPLTPQERRELSESRQYLTNEMWKQHGPRARLLNLMWAARTAGDWKWFIELGKEWEQLERGGEKCL